MTLTRIAQCVVEEVSTIDGVRGGAIVICDAKGEPALWIGDHTSDRATINAYLDGGHRHDPCFAHVRDTYVPQSADGILVAPLLGADGVIGMLRVALDHFREVDRAMFTTIAAYVSIRIAVLGIGLETARTIDSLTPRQREVAELVAHGCTNIEIADMLSISANAVKKHVSRVLVVLDVSNRTELAALTGRWRMPSGSHQSLPSSLQVVRRNPAKPVAVLCPEEVA